MDDLVAKKGVLIGISGFFIGLIIGIVMFELNNTQKKYKMNLKCIQGELYEEVRTNMFVKSHLQCFEQRTF